MWEVCPYFPSGPVIASDIQTGLYVYRPRRDYGLVRVVVQPTAEAGFTVVIDAQGDSLVTPDDGTVVFAADPGPHTVTIRRFGFFDEVRAFTASVGSRDTVVVPMRARAVGDFAGVVTDAVSAEPLEDAEVIVESTPLHVHTDSLGAYQLLQVPDDLYRVTYRAPGHVPLSYVRRIGPGYDGLSVALAPASAWEPMELDPGFTVGDAGDEATSGQWVRVEPLGTGLQAGLVASTGSSLQRVLAGRQRTPSPFHEGHEGDGVLPGSVQPEFDRTPGAGTMCWVTGQGTTPGSVDEADVDGGRTSLTTRVFDLTGYADPVIGYWRWFYSSTPTDSNDWLQVLVSADGGASWVPAETVTGEDAHWEEGAIRVRDFVVPGASVQLRFVAADLGAASIVESAIDDLVIYEAGAATGISPHGGRVALRAPWPNPTRDVSRFAFTLPDAGPADVSVLDLQGRVLRVLRRGMLVAGTHEFAWDGRDAAGRPTPPGLYFLSIDTADQRLRARLVRVR